MVIAEEIAHLLTHIHPAQLKTLSPHELADLAEKMRVQLVENVQQTGGHLGAGLGAVELTIALHTVFDTPRDVLVWDTGHQTYPHKMLTGRLPRMHTLRQKGGLSGFAKRCESVYDSFGAGHAGTAASAALGMACAIALKGEDRYTICVIGDGAMSAGMTFEALNNMHDVRRLIVVLNDNNMSISPSVGGLSAHLARVQKDSDPTFFTHLGLCYVGPIDGHNIDTLLTALRAVRTMSLEGPILLHVRTQKGKGWPPAEGASDKGHAIVAETLKKQTAPASSYTHIFGQCLVELAQKDETVVAITAAMSTGTGLDTYKRLFPKRFFDVGIAEQHAITFAAGLCCEGLKPFVAIYSTFLQRAYDQIVHDVALQNLPVRFAIDRAGLVGPDGPTHAGSFDLACLLCVPNMVIMAPSDGAELVAMMHFAALYQGGPIAFRYPRRPGISVDGAVHSSVELGKGRLIQSGGKIAIISLGTPLNEVRHAGHLLTQTYALVPTIVDARFAKPFDSALVTQILQHHTHILFVEDGARGGFGSHVLSFLHNQNLIEPHHRIHSLTLPDAFIDHGSMEEVYAQTELTARGIINAVLKLFHVEQ